MLSFAKLCANHEPEPPTPLTLTLTPKTMATTTTTTTRRSRQLLLLLAAKQRSRNVVNWQAAVRHCVCHMCVCVCMGVSVLVCGGYVCVLCLLAKNLHSARSWPKVHKKCPTIATHAHTYIYKYIYTHIYTYTCTHTCTLTLALFVGARWSKLVS